MKITNEAEAKAHIFSIFHDAEIRHKCLGMFADAVAEANVYGRNRWAVAYTADKVRLIVGHLIVCTLVDGRAWLALDKGLLQSSDRESTLEQSDDWEWGGYEEYREIPSRNGYYMPSENHAEMWSEIRRLHFESIYRAANESTMDKRAPQGHSPEILRYLRNNLERHIPDPLYNN